MNVPIITQLRSGSYRLVTGHPGAARQAIAYHLFRFGAVVFLVCGVSLVFSAAELMSAWQEHERDGGIRHLRRIEIAEARSFVLATVSALGGACCVAGFSGYRRHSLVVYHGKSERLRQQAIRQRRYR